MTVGPSEQKLPVPTGLSVGASVSLVALVVANLVPLVGVALFGWDVRQILLLYWAENVVVAFWAAMRMARVGGIGAVPLIGFFAVHFGIFTFVHGVFVGVLTSLDEMQGGFPSPVALLGEVPGLALFGLFLSHGVSFFGNFLLGGEWRTAELKEEMARPYPRMIVLHVAIVMSGMFVVVLGQPTALLMLLVVLKIGLDVVAHRRSHRKRVTSDFDTRQDQPGGDGND
ncbi:MAG: DUF6498-containing protein [Planctomycetota bacterium]